MFNENRVKVVAAPIVAIIISSVMLAGSVNAAEEEAATVAFPDTWMLRLGAYIVDGSSTQFSVSSPVGLGTVIDYQRDLNGESRDTIPRIDAYYRFNDRHRIDFTTFAIDRKGTRSIDVAITIEDQIYNANETVNSEIKYNLYKLGYAYSFYHSPKVELSLSAGLNITSYDLSFSNSTGDKVEAAGFTAPLPMFGLRLGYAITPKWNVHYVTEAFFIEFEDTVKGALISYELNMEYKLFKNFAIGAGLARFGTSVEVNDDDWKGKVSDNYRGYTVFGTLYF